MMEILEPLTGTTGDSKNDIRGINLINKWTWGHIWTDQDYRTAMSDSSCYNMFVEAIMQRLAVIGIWTYEGQSQHDFPIGSFIPDGFWGNYLGSGYGRFNGIKGSRDWYKGMGETSMRKGIPWGWPFLQKLVDDIRIYFVRTIDETGNPIQLSGRTVLPMVGSSGTSTPVPAPLYLHLDNDVYYYKSKYTFPHPSGWIRKFPRRIRSVTDPGRNGEKARLVPVKPSGVSIDTPQWNDYGMIGWYFSKQSNIWKYNPNLIEEDQIETRGLIAKGDTPGPWILNNLRDSINQLEWTWSTPDYASTFDVDVKAQITFNGRDKVYLRNDSATFKGQIVSNSSSPNDSNFWLTNIQQTISRSLPQLHTTAFGWKRIPGIFPADDYRVGFIASNFGITTVMSPGDPTGTLLESWPWPSYFTFSGNWRGHSQNPKEDPLAYTPYSEGISRNIDFYSLPFFTTDFSVPPPRPKIPIGMKLIKSSGIHNTWNWDYWNEVFNPGSAAVVNGILGVVKWDFKYNRNSKNATWKGLSDAFLSTN